MNKYLYLIFIFFIYTASLLAQEKPLVEEWIQKDIEATDVIPKLLLELPQEPSKIAEILGSRIYHDAEELGFGAKRVEESQGFGYTNIKVTAFTFEDSIISYRITLDDSLSSSKVREKIIEAWKKNVRAPFQEYENGIYYEIKNDSILDKYKKSVGKELGEAKAVKIPNKLKEAYDYLISPENNSIVGKDGCGPGGIIPQGNGVINLFVKNKKIDLLENILRGYNPGGRIYAAIALLEMKKSRLKLKPETEETLAKVINLDIKIDVCLGGVVFSKNAKEILQEYKLL